MQQSPLDDTYTCDTEEGNEKRGNNNEESEQLPVLVKEFKFIDQTCDHRLHPTHLRQEIRESETV